MKVLRFANGEEQKIIKEEGRYFVTETARFRKANYASCVVEIKEAKKKEPLPFELPEEEQEELTEERKPARKSSKKSTEKE